MSRWERRWRRAPQRHREPSCRCFLEERGVDQQEVPRHEAAEVANKKRRGHERRQLSDDRDLQHGVERDDAAFQPVEHHDVAEIPSEEQHTHKRNKVRRQRGRSPIPMKAEAARWLARMRAGDGGVRTSCCGGSIARGTKRPAPVMASTRRWPSRRGMALPSALRSAVVIEANLHGVRVAGAGAARGARC